MTHLFLKRTHDLSKNVIATKTLNNSDSLIENLENDIYAAQIIAYTQGFLVMEKASQQYNWNLQIATINGITEKHGTWTRP